MGSWFCQQLLLLQGSECKHHLNVNLVRYYTLYHTIRLSSDVKIAVLVFRKLVGEEVDQSVVIVLSDIIISSCEVPCGIIAEADSSRRIQEDYVCKLNRLICGIQIITILPYSMYKGSDKQCSHYYSRGRVLVLRSSQP